jgi:hypothetical protein
LRNALSQIQHVFFLKKRFEENDLEDYLASKRQRLRSAAAEHVPGIFFMDSDSGSSLKLIIISSVSRG